MSRRDTIEDLNMPQKIKGVSYAQQGIIAAHTALKGYSLRSLLRDTQIEDLNIRGVIFSFVCAPFIRKETKRNAHRPPRFFSIPSHAEQSPIVKATAKARFFSIPSHAEQSPIVRDTAKAGFFSIPSRAEQSPIIRDTAKARFF